MCLWVYGMLWNNMQTKAAQYEEKMLSMFKNHPFKSKIELKIKIDQYEKNKNVINCFSILSSPNREDNRVSCPGP